MTGHTPPAEQSRAVKPYQCHHIPSHATATAPDESRIATAIIKNVSLDLRQISCHVPVGAAIVALTPWDYECYDLAKRGGAESERLQFAARLSKKGSRLQPPHALMPPSSRRGNGPIVQRRTRSLILTEVRRKEGRVAGKVAKGRVRRTRAKVPVVHIGRLPKAEILPISRSAARLKNMQGGEGSAGQVQKSAHAQSRLF